MRLVLLLSSRCGSCFEIAKQLGKKFPEGVHILLAGGPPGEAERFIQDHALPDAKCTVDDGDQIVQKMGIDASPLGLRVGLDGNFSTVSTVPAARHIGDLLVNQAELGGTKQ